MFRSSSSRLISCAVAGAFAIQYAQVKASATTVALPPPDLNAAPSYSATSFRYSPSGILYAWDGQTIWQDTSGGFVQIGTAPPGNSSDPGQINFSPDGSTILVSNGQGGLTGGSYAGEIFKLPAPVGSPLNPLPQATLVGNVPFNYDLIPVPTSSALSGAGSNYFVDVGTADFSGSSVSLFNSSNGATQPVVNNIPGASAFLAINPSNNSLYVEDGYGNDPSDTGDIRSFSLTALAGGTMNFSQGAVFDTAGFGDQSGSGLFFDQEGDLISGGADGITTFAPDGHIIFVQDPTGGSYATLAYDPAYDQALEGPINSFGNSATVYSGGTLVPEPTSLGLLAIAGMIALGRRRRSM